MLLGYSLEFHMNYIYSPMIYSRISTRRTQDKIEDHGCVLLSQGKDLLTRIKFEYKVNTETDHSIPSPPPTTPNQLINIPPCSSSYTKQSPVRNAPEDKLKRGRSTGRHHRWLSCGLIFYSTVNIILDQLQSSGLS